MAYYDRFCARCRCWLYASDTTGESSLYSPNRPFTICEPCFFAEDAQIEQEGTNNLPDEIERYRANVRLGPIGARRACG